MNLGTYNENLGGSRIKLVNLFNNNDIYVSQDVISMKFIEDYLTLWIFNSNMSMFGDNMLKIICQSFSLSE